LKSTVKCLLCGLASHTFDPYMMLSLPVRVEKKPIRLESLFSDFITEESLLKNE